MTVTSNLLAISSSTGLIGVVSFAVSSSAVGCPVVVSVLVSSSVLAGSSFLVSGVSVSVGVFASDSSELSCTGEDLAAAKSSPVQEKI